MAYLATNRFPGDGSTTTYEINFVGKYLSREDVYAYREDNETRARYPVSISPGQFINDTTIGGFVPTPPTQTLVIYRSTRKQPLVDFVNGARLSEFNLDLATRQGLFIAMEAIDAASPDTVNALLEAVAVVQGLVGDAQSAAVTALQAVVYAQTAANTAVAAGADALDAQLAAEAANTAAQAALVSTLTARDAANGSAVAAAGSASSASSSAAAASTSAGTAAGHATAAGNSASSANSSRILAENAKQAASSSQSAASGSATAASASATAAAGSATSAAGSATSATQAASNAASSASAASASASTASTKAGEASASASSASTSATNAGSSATAAANSASAALVYANSASNSAVNAENAKIAAANSASSASSSANTASTAAAQASSFGGMHCRLILQDAASRTVKLERCGGSTLMINNTVRVIPEGGVTVALPNSGVIHHLYVSWASSSMTLSFSTTAPTYVPSRGQWTDPASWDRVYVGSVRPNALFEPRRFLRSLYNGSGAPAFSGSPAGDMALTWNGAAVQLVYMPYLLMPGDVIVVEGSSNVISDPNDRLGELQLRLGGAILAVSRNTHSGSPYSWRSYYRSVTLSRGELDAPSQADFELFYNPISATGGTLTVNGAPASTSLTVTVHPYRW